MTTMTHSLLRGVNRKGSAGCSPMGCGLRFGKRPCLLICFCFVFIGMNAIMMGLRPSLWTQDSSLAAQTTASTEEGLSLPASDSARENFTRPVREDGKNSTGASPLEAPESRVKVLEQNPANNPACQGKYGGLWAKLCAEGFVKQANAILVENAPLSIIQIGAHTGSQLIPLQRA